MPQNIITAEIDTEKQQQDLIARVLTQLNTYTQAPPLQVAPTFTPLAQAQQNRTTTTAPAAANEGLNFMRGAFKNGFIS